MADVAQPRRSRRFSFSSRRPQSVVVPNEATPSPPVTTIGFPIDAFPLSSDTQQERTSSWRNVFRRSQSVDRTNSRAPSSDRQSARRLVKKHPVQGLRKDAQLSTQVPTLPDISLLSNESNSPSNGRAKDAGIQPTKAKSPQINSTSNPGRGRSDAAIPQQRETQPNYRTPTQIEIPPAPATPTLRRVGSPFYHTASNSPAVEEYGVKTTVTTGQPKSSLDTAREDSMIPDSLRVGRYKKKLQAQSPTTDKSESPTRENFFKLNTDDFDLPDYPAEQTIDDSIASPSLPTDQISSLQSLGMESYNQQSGERPKTVRPLKTTALRPSHAKTPSSSSSSSAASSAFSSLGEPATPVSSNASSTNLDSTSFGGISSSRRTAKKEIPRNTMSPKHDKYLAKIFVVCCRCNYWHDIPSGLYAQMVIPESMLFSGLPEPSGARSSRSSSQARSAKWSDSKYSSSSSSSSEVSFSSKLASSSPKTTVKCSWCRHEMAKSCCASWTTMVHLIEKHH